MKRKIALILIPVLLLLIAAFYVLRVPNSKYPETNFAFRFEFGSCDNDVLDTFAGTFTKDMIVEPAITIPLELSEEQMVAIYQKMEQIDFFDYPAVFTIPKPEGMQSPAMQYYIEVRNGNVTKTVRWDGEYFSKSDRQANNLEDLFYMIMKMIWEHPDYLQLPELKAGCV